MLNFTLDLLCMKEDLKNKHSGTLKQITFSECSLALFFWLLHKDKWQHKLLHFHMLEHSAACFYCKSALLQLFPLCVLFLSNLDPCYEHTEYPNSAEKKTLRYFPSTAPQYI